MKEGIHVKSALPEIHASKGICQAVFASYFYVCLHLSPSQDFISIQESNGDTCAWFVQSFQAFFL